MRQDILGLRGEFTAFLHPRLPSSGRTRMANKPRTRVSSQRYLSSVSDNDIVYLASCILPIDQHRIFSHPRAVFLAFMDPSHCSMSENHREEHILDQHRFKLISSGIARHCSFCSRLVALKLCLQGGIAVRIMGDRW